MVDYSEWISIVRIVAGRKGANLNDFETNSNIVSAGAGVWNDRKQELQQMSVRRAEGVAEEEISVR